MFRAAWLVFPSLFQLFFQFQDSPGVIHQMDELGLGIRCKHRKSDERPENESVDGATEDIGHPEHEHYVDEHSAESDECPLDDEGALVLLLTLFVKRRHPLGVVPVDELTPEKGDVELEKEIKDRHAEQAGH